jgi:hypothetical protein
LQADVQRRANQPLVAPQRKTERTKPPPPTGNIVFIKVPTNFLATYYHAGIFAIAAGARSSRMVRLTILGKVVK